VTLQENPQENPQETKASLREAEAAVPLEELVVVEALVGVDTRTDRHSSAEILPRTTIAPILRILNLFKLSLNLRRPLSKFFTMHLSLILTCHPSRAILNVFKSMF
jgi:hypothetical protein